MFSRFDVKVETYFYNRVINNHLEKGKKLYFECQEKAKYLLDDFILKNGHVDGNALKEKWFSVGHYDVFISHSHKDCIKVQAFAGWLYDEFGLTSFIDSCVWGYCDELLKQIDDKYCKKDDGKTYDYNRRNYATSHVHMMLSTALSEMIDNSECIMFYNTPNSISMIEDLDIIKHEKKKVTISPWIYHELSMTSLIEKKQPSRNLRLYKAFMEHRDDNSNSELLIEYEISDYLKNLLELRTEQLEEWKNEKCLLAENRHPLDILYQITFNNKQRR